MTMTARAQIAHDRRLLAAAFPKLFRPSRSSLPKLPLKRGIIKDIVTAGLHDNDGARVSRRRIHAALRDYCAGPRYAEVNAVPGPRYDLNGEACGFVTEEESRHYAEIHFAWRQRKERYEQRYKAVEGGYDNRHYQ